MFMRGDGSIEFTVDDIQIVICRPGDEGVADIEGRPEDYWGHVDQKNIRIQHEAFVIDRDKVARRVRCLLGELGVSTPVELIKKLLDDAATLTLPATPAAKRRKSPEG
jgi:hypothetical protein